MSFSSRIQNTTRSLRCLVLVAAALFSGAAYALPTDVVFHVCRTPGHFTGGEAWDAEPSCPDQADFSLTVADLEPGFQIMTTSGGDLYWYPISSMGGRTFYVDRGGEYIVLGWEESGYVPPDTDPPDEEPGGFDPADLDPATVAAAFSAGWVLVALALGAGMGFKVILDVLRKM